MNSRDGLRALGVLALGTLVGCAGEFGFAESSLRENREQPSEPTESPDAGYEVPTECDPTREYPEGQNPCPTSYDSDCWVTGGGKITGGGSFGGNAKQFGAITTGEWNHITDDGHHLHGSPDPMVPIACDYDGGPGADHPVVTVNRAEFYGIGTWDGEDCYYRVIVVDHGEPGSLDEYSLEVSASAGGTPYYARSGIPIATGNIQIHPSRGGRP